MQHFNLLFSAPAHCFVLYYCSSSLSLFCYIIVYYVDGGQHWWASAFCGSPSLLFIIWPM